MKSALLLDSDIWDRLYSEAQKEFEEEPPEPKPIPKEPYYFSIRPKPEFSSAKYSVQKTLLDSILSKDLNQRLKEAELQFSKDTEDWLLEKERLEAANKRDKNNYETLKNKIQSENDNQHLNWLKRAEAYYNERAVRVQRIQALRSAYESLSSTAVETYNKELLINSGDKNDFYEKEFDIYYNPNNKIITIDFRLPASEDVPKVKEVKHNATKDIFEEKNMSNAEFQKYYEEMIYQIILRTIYEVITYNDKNVIECVVFNGYVKTLDLSTGLNIEPCILSIQVSRTAFNVINLSNVDPKSCFKSLKGISAANLASKAAVAPIIKIDRTDKRFILQKEVIGALENESNLATMNWEDFEHLVSEIFEKEFSSNGGEVKVTRASRDGGVDAIAFDPDPIRGGKIVIQAKRYTNTVGVSAVRDLYGTVMNEGATKGILVTTADYGPDAYDFAKGKPLTLLNGANLLHLLEKHGHHAKIDLREAKKLLTEQNS
ncbi:MAG: restriction endonuclease [Syntrophothermus sp.]